MRLRERPRLPFFFMKNNFKNVTERQPNLWTSSSRALHWHKGRFVVLTKSHRPSPTSLWLNLTRGPLMEIYTVASSPCGSIVLLCWDKPLKDKSVIVDRDCKQWAGGAAQPSRIHERSIGGQLEVKNTHSRVPFRELKASHETLFLSRRRDLSCHLGGTEGLIVFRLQGQKQPCIKILI